MGHNVFSGALRPVVVKISITTTNTTLFFIHLPTLFSTFLFFNVLKDDPDKAFISCS